MTVWTSGRFTLVHHMHLRCEGLFKNAKVPSLTLSETRKPGWLVQDLLGVHWARRPFDTGFLSCMGAVKYHLAAACSKEFDVCELQ